MGPEEGTAVQPASWGAWEVAITKTGKGKAPSRRRRLVLRGIRTAPSVRDLDRLAAEVVKRRAGYRCERCGRSYAPGSSEEKKGGRGRRGGLNWAHLITRRRHRTRWDPDAAVALCAGCHFFLDSHPQAKIAFAVGKLGQEVYDLLLWQSEVGGPVDRKAIRLYLEQYLAELEREESA